MTNELKQNIRDAAKALTRARKVLILFPADPDGDTLGSLLALGLALMDQRKKVTLWCEDAIPTQYQYLPGSELIGSWSYEKPDAVVSAGLRSIRVGCRHLGGALGEVTQDLLRAMKADITSPIVTCLDQAKALV